ncbi:SCAN domain-containing protein 3 [Trichonephila clavipes]|nr:SCAN domain-containing protein 3 [Trichonephila clavipes]
MPLSKNTVSRRIDEMGEGIEKQLVEKLKTRKLSVQMDESTLRDSEAALITYVRYIDKGHFAEEMLFCKILESTTTSKDIFNKLNKYLDVNDIPMTIITSCAADGVPNMMGKKNGRLKLMKDANPEMIPVHCVIHRQTLVAKNISSVLNEVLQTVIKCVTVIKASAKCERLFKLFCEEQNEDHVRLLLHSEVRWLSKGNCLKRFMGLFDTLSDFLNDKPQMKHLLTIDATRGLLATDHVILNNGQVTWTTPELATPLLTTTPHQRKDVSALDRFNVHRCPTRRVFSGTGFELMTYLPWSDTLTTGLPQPVQI